MRGLAAWAALLVLGGCASTDPRPAHAEVDRQVFERLAEQTGWQDGPPAQAELDRRVDELLKGGLDELTVTRLALLNSPQLQATYEELGVSQAELVQAGLLHNPSVSLHVGFPFGGGDGREEQLSAVQSFLELFVLPLRKHVAKDKLTAQTLRVADTALQIATQARVLFYKVQRDLELVALRRRQAEGEQATAELVERLWSAGNMTELERFSAQAEAAETKLMVTQDELQLAQDRGALSELLGLWGARTNWQVHAPLPELPKAEPDEGDVELWAMRQRLDLDAARKEAALLGKAVDLERTTRWFGVVEVGMDVHHDPDGPKVIGPSLTLELPLFDRREAEIARLEAEERIALRKLQGLAVKVRAEVNEARARLLAARTVARGYETEVLPARSSAVNQALLQYNAMQLAVPAVWKAKRALLEAEREHQKALCDYWEARAELSRRIGGPGGRRGPPTNDQPAGAAASGEVTK